MKILLGLVLAEGSIKFLLEVAFWLEGKVTIVLGVSFRLKKVKNPSLG